MPYGTGGNFSLTLRRCKTWQTPDDLFQSIEALIDEFKITVLSHKELAPLPVDDQKQGLREYCRLQYKTNPKELGEKYGLEQASLWLNLECPFLPKVAPPVWDKISMVAATYEQEYNEITFQMELGKRYHSDPSLERVLRYQQVLIDLYTSMASFLIPLLAPDYVTIEEHDEMEQVFIKSKDVLQRKLKFIYWANYFAVGFFEKSQEQAFKRAPMGILQTIHEGFWYYLNDKFSALSDEEVWSAEVKAKEYFSFYFPVNQVQWRFIPS
jgi:hypothetical protein